MLKEKLCSVNVLFVSVLTCSHEIIVAPTLVYIVSMQACCIPDYWLIELIVTVILYLLFYFWFVFFFNVQILSRKWISKGILTYKGYVTDYKSFIILMSLLTCLWIRLQGDFLSWNILLYPLLCHICVSAVFFYDISCSCCSLQANIWCLQFFSVYGEYWT